MIIKEVTQVGNPVLKSKAKFVSNIRSKETQKVVTNLIDSMHYHDLVGMAASQIGEKLRIFVTEVRKTKYRDEDANKLRVFINPKITWFSKKEVVIYEGCGSVAYGNLFGPVRRPEKIEVDAFDEKGKSFKLKVGGLLSRVIQHEYDHLEGVEFTEKISDMKKIMSKGEYLKMKERS
jgi:peptide deformylase